MGRRNATNPKPIEQHYSITDAAKLLNFHRHTIQKMIRDGKLTAHYFSQNLVRISASELNRILEGTSVNRGAVKEVANAES